MNVFASLKWMGRRTMLITGAFVLMADPAIAADRPIEVPVALNTDNLSVVRVIAGRGVQIYACERNPAGVIGWVLKGPKARLFDSQDKLVGTHYAGPTWENLQGGKVVGAVRTSMPAPVDHAVPWLLLDIKSRDGAGVFTKARAIVRMETTGGVAPVDGCDETRSGWQRPISYTATYVFLE